MREEEGQFKILSSSSHALCILRVWKFIFLFCRNVSVSVSLSPIEMSKKRERRTHSLFFFYFSKKNNNNTKKEKQQKKAQLISPFLYVNPHRFVYPLYLVCNTISFYFYFLFFQKQQRQRQQRPRHSNKRSFKRTQKE